MAQDDPGRGSTLDSRRKYMFRVADGQGLGSCDTGEWRPGGQRYGEQADEAGSRQRTAINLARLKHDEVSRGFELATPN